MIWLFMQSLGGFSGPRQYLDDQYTDERDGQRIRVLRSALVMTRTYYAAVEIVSADSVRNVTAIVCLVRYNPRARDGFIFGYKGMDESMGPCEADCPASILDLLTPTEQLHAVEWRERCWVNIARRAAQPKLYDGHVVVFDAPITFADGTSHDRLHVVVDPRWPRRTLFRAPDGRVLYRIPGLVKLNYRVEGEAPA